ncbi:MAG: oligosaccharide flippase family protein [Phenylobacterium sp.]|uniref:oligosaccharide flippase family protein n=1 Tax=Phenylobacterium sp. TaxID=1871053 RepID=UPI00391B6C5E
MAQPPPRRSAAGPTLYAFSRVWAQIAGGVLFLATSVRIGPAEFGEFAIATSIFGALSVFVGQGTYEYVIKARESDNAAPTVFFVNLLTASLASVLAIVVGLAIPHIVHSESIGRMLMLLIPAFYLLSMNTLMESVIMKHGEIKKVAVASLVTETVALGVALTALMSGAGVLALVFQRITREGVIMLSYAVTSRWSPRIAFHFDEAAKALAFARNIIATRFIGLGSVAAVDVLIGAGLGTADAGLFRLVSRLLTMASDVLFQPFRAMMWVSLPPLQHDRAAFGRTSLQLLEVFGVGFFALMAGAALIAGPVFPLVFDPEWHNAASIVLILAVARLVGIPAYLCEVVFALQNRTGTMAATALFGAVLSAAAAFLVAPYGLLPLAFSMVAVAIVTQIYVLPAVARSSGMPIMAYLGLVGRLSLNAAMMTAFVGPWVLLTPRIGLSGWALVASAVMIGAAVYAVAARRFTPHGYGAYEGAVLSGFNRLRRLREGRPSDQPEG